MRLGLRVVLLAAFSWLTLPVLPVRAAAPPNIIYILADDLGFGAVGFNGQAEIKTPNLDALAVGGMRLTNLYSCPTCAATRASLLTGFHQGHSSVDGNDEIDSGFRAIDIMTPQVLAPAGYTSAVFGKWGFGADGTRSLTGADPLPTVVAPASLPNNHGFDEFYGYLNHGAAQDYFYSYMWQIQAGAPNGVATVANNGGAGGTTQYTHDLIAAKTEQFVAAHASDTDPFYMQVSYTIPHWDIDSIVSAPGGYGMYASKPWTSQQKAYAAMITRMDASIGSLVEKLKDPNGDHNQSDSILNNTLIMFASDNGPTGEDASPVDFFNANGQFRGGKFEAYEGGIHMPALAYWPGKIAAGSSSAYRTDMSDFMATAADLAGVETPVGIDGTSIVPTLTGVGQQRQRDYIVIEQQGSRPANLPDPDPRVTRWTVIRQDGMKLIRYDDESSELYDLATNPSETAPLSLAVPANAAIASQLESFAIAEGVTRGTVEYRTWTGPNGGNVQDRSSWDGVGPPTNQWSAVIANSTASPRIAHVSADVTTLGVEVRGTSTSQVVDIHPGRTLTGRNEVRISNHGRVDLEDGTLASNRWVNVRAGGEIRGKGTVAGDVYNQGVISPGRPTGAPSWPTVTPSALPAANYDSGVVNALTFDFTGVQDIVPLFAASTLNPYLEVTSGLDWGPGTGPRWSSGGSNAGNELNHIGHATANLTDAITAGNYISFTVDPTNGAGIIPSSVSFRLWRNGTAAAQNFAILSSIGGFTAGAALSPQLLTITDTGSGNQHLLTASIPGTTALSGPVEFRLYGWGATVNTGNTHVNLASLNARIVGVPTLEFDFTGVQDGAPLTALKRTDQNLTLTSGLNFGPGVAPRGANNVGNEFNVAGFSTGASQQSALTGDDYVTFSVQAITGMTMIPDSASFTLWRPTSTSATDYALFSSVAGFTPSQQLAQAHITTTGSGNQLVLSGPFLSPQPTTDSVEFRLYGWGASSALDSTHLVTASMRARFASIVGTPIDPTGSITVQGDFFHQAGGQIAIDLGGHSAGIDYDTINVVGKVDLAGDLNVSLADVGGSPFAPASGDIFQILTATQGVTGQFADITLPQLAWDLAWNVNYSATAVTLAVVVTGDFNHDGFVDSSDYVVWRKNGGSQADYDIWRANFGTPVGSGSEVFVDSSTSPTVPEPASLSLLILGMGLGIRRRYRITSRVSSTR